MSTVYFIGAGASAEDGIPITSQVNYGIAAFLRENAADLSELLAYYGDLFGLRSENLAIPHERWNAFLDDRKRGLDDTSGLPNLIETLSLVDVCIAGDYSLGVSSQRDANDRRHEMDPTFLRVVRAQLTMAIATAVQASTYYQRSPVAHKFVASVMPGDAVISTNWDALLDRCFTARWQKQHDQSWTGQAPVRYFCVGERPVDYRGRDVKPADPEACPLLKLHGGLNWFGCSCCGTVYINLDGSFVIDGADRREGYEECECGAGLMNVMIAPSFHKDYRNVSLRSVWRESQQRLERADRWVFVGYSLPPDDYHIRAMLMRAMRSRSAKGLSVEVHTVLRPSARYEEKAMPYRDLFRIGRLIEHQSTLADWLAADDR